MRSLDDYKKLSKDQLINIILHQNAQMESFVSSNGSSDSILTSTVMLKEEYVERNKKNSKFSIRSFAKMLDLSSGSLTEILSGKRPLTTEMATKICSQLKFPAPKRERFTELVRAERATLKKEKQEILSIIKSQNEQLSDALKPPDKLYNYIYKWQHYAVLSCLLLKDFKSDVDWIAQRLQLSSEIVSETLELLEKCNAIKIESDQFLPFKENFFGTKHTDERASCLKKLTKSIITHAVEIFDKQPALVTNSAYTCHSITIDKSKIAYAQKMLDDSIYKIANYLESGSKDEVYFLSMQFFPASTNENGFNGES